MHVVFFAILYVIFTSNAVVSGKMIYSFSGTEAVGIAL